MSAPPMKMRPLSGRSKPAIMRSVVVLPQPLGAEQGDDLALAHLEGDVVHRGDRAEAPGDVLKLEDGHGQRP